MRSAARIRTKADQHLPGGKREARNRIAYVDALVYVNHQFHRNVCLSKQTGNKGKRDRRIRTAERAKSFTGGAGL